MAQFFPFSALRPIPDRVNTVSCPPYDVLTTQEAKALAKDNPDSLLHVTLPEIDGEAAIETLADRGGAALRALASRSDVMILDDQAYFYLYEQTSEMEIRTGIFGTVHTDDYHSGKIIRHELTRPNKVEERTQHILAQRAHAEPVMLAYKNTPALKACVRAALIDAIPLYDFTDEQQVRHRVYQAHPDSVGEIQTAFREIDLYIADGHHRCEAAYQASERMISQDPTALEESRRFPAVIIPHDELVILSYNRYLKHLSDLKWSDIAEVLKLQPSDDQVPNRSGLVKVGVGQDWYEGYLPESSSISPADRIDAQGLQDSVLRPIYGIEDIRTDPRIGFSGGSESITTLKKGIESGEIDIAFVMYPVDIEQLFAVSDAGLLMPPKSTWFEPKLRSGILIHTF